MLRRLLFARSSIPYLQKSLDVCWLRHRAIASNVANVTTPGYREVRVVFEQELRKASCRLTGELTHSRHIYIGKPRMGDVVPQVALSRDSSTAGEINTVDIDRKMAELAQNQLLFSFSARLLARKYEAIKASIRGRALK